MTNFSKTAKNTKQLLLNKFVHQIAKCYQHGHFQGDFIHQLTR